MKRAFALLLAAAPCAAEDTIVVTASRTAPGDVAAIERDAIDALQPLTALELLDRVAGVRAFQKGGAGGSSYLSIRGGEPNFTLVLLEGVRVGDPTNSQGGAFDFAQLDPQAIERIEVARGGLSAVQGADALSGVVQVRLREAKAGETSLGVGASADTRGGFAASLTGMAGWSGGGLLASAGWTDSGNLTRGSDLHRWQGLARLTQTSGAFELSALALHARTDRATFPEDSGGPRLAVLRDRERRDTRLTILAFDVARPSTLTPHVAVRWSRQDADAITPAIAPGVFDPVPAIAADTRFDRLDLLADVRVEAGMLSLAAGAEHIAEDARSRGSVDVGFLLPADFDIDRTITSGFAEATFAPSARFSLTTGARYDDASGGGSELSGRASLRGQPFRDGPALSASISEGFKLPSLFALAYPLIANPDLKPERGTSVEAGIEQRWGEIGRLRLAVFRNRFRNLIDFDPALFTNVNRTRVVTEGVEIEAEARPRDDLRLAASLTHLDVDSVTPLRSRPRWQGSFGAAWRASERLTFDLGAAFNSDFNDSSVPTGLVRADGHIELDAGVRWRASETTTLSLVVRNLLSADYEEAVGFPEPGRVARLNLSASF